MKYFVDVKFAGELDFSTLELQNTTFINDQHKKSEADMIWKINFKGEDIYIYLLIEFQSTVDKYMALRFGSYIFEFYKWLARQKDMDKLPAVFPILIYNGNKTWTAKDNIRELINDSIPPEYIPSFRFFKIIENELPKERLLKIHNALSLVFYVDNSDVEEIKNAINELYNLLSEEQPVLVKEFTLWLNNLFKTAGYQMEDIEQIIGKMKNTKEVKAMFLASVKEHDNKIRRENTIDIVLKMLEKGAELQFIADVTGLSLEEIEQLRPN